MKTRKYFKKSMKVGATFSFAVAMTMALSAFSTADCKMASASYDKAKTASASANLTTVGLQPFQEISEVMCASKKLQEIDAEKARLEQTLTKEIEHQKATRAERNRNYGMAPGMSFQPSNGLAEMIHSESKVKSLNNKLNELKKVEKAIYEKYGSDIQRVKFI